MVGFRLRRCIPLALFWFWLLGCSRSTLPTDNTKPAASVPQPLPVPSAPAPERTAEQEPDPLPRVLAPLTVTLSPAARARVNAVDISSARYGVKIKREGAGWVTAYAPHCKVPVVKVEAALDSLLHQRGAATTRRIESGSDFVLKVVVYDANEKLLKFATGPATEHGILAQLDDGSTVDLRHFTPELFPADPSAWCEHP